MAATAPQQLSQLFAIPVSKQPAQWDSCYRTSFHPWDRSGPSLALGDLLLQRPDLVPSAIELDSRSNPLRSSTGTVIRKTALVPGCGLGHDVRLLASFGYDVWALDVSETAIGKAKEQKWESLYKENEGNEMGRITWVAADFFKEEWVAGTGTDGSGKFDLIFDYTVSIFILLYISPLTITSSFAPFQRICVPNGPSALPTSSPPKAALYASSSQSASLSPTTALRGVYAQKFTRLF